MGRATAAMRGLHTVQCPIYNHPFPGAADMSVLMQVLVPPDENDGQGHIAHSSHVAVPTIGLRGGGSCVSWGPEQEHQPHSGG